ncbi:MAG: FAD-binding protein [Desulfobacterales bacterium]|nr:MAG: FAD-binding protein [Desulfobacterales bacterium]
MEYLTCDVLVVGSGAAGLRAAIAARATGLDVLVISKATPGKATSTIVSGGVFAGTREGQAPDEHRDLTLQAGRGINQPELVEVLVAEGPRRLRELLQWGIKAALIGGYLFSDGRPTIWGEEIVRCLVARNKTLGTRFMGGLVVTDLKMEDGRAAVIAHAADTGQWRTIRAKALILATGGAGALYRRHDNPQRMLGEGYFLALKAGAVLQDMEFVQFYPLALAEPGYSAFLLPPQLADFGRLYNGHNEEIHEKYGILERPAGERARDRLSQALFEEIYRQGQEVWLDLRQVSEEQWCADPFSASTRHHIGERCAAKRRPVRVAPVAHHVMGGIRIDPWGATSVPGLFAAGEVTGGLHGANRMGGNALTETLVFGKRAGETAAAWAQSHADGHRAASLLKEAETPESRSRSPNAPSNPERLLKKLRRILWDDGGILRDHQGLTRAARRVAEIRAEALDLSPGVHPKEVQSTLELQLGAATAALILESARRREESRGAHFRTDFADQNDASWRGHLQIRVGPGGGPVWNFAPLPAAPER